MSGEFTLYVWGAYLMGLVMIVTEVVLLKLRELAIRGQYDGRRDASAQIAGGDETSAHGPPAADR